MLNQTFLCGKIVNNLPAGDSRDTGLIAGSGGGRNGNPLQYSCLGNLKDRGDWWAIVRGVAESLMRLSTRVRACGNTHTHTHTHTLTTFTELTLQG